MKTEQEKHDLAVAKVERFSRNLPGLSPGAEALRLSMLSAAKAELALSTKALEYERTKGPPNANELALWRLLNVAPPSP
jgi:hypothetical protein